MDYVTLLNYNSCYKDNGEKYTEEEIQALKKRFKVGNKVTVDGRKGVFKNIIEEKDGLYGEVEYFDEKPKKGKKNMTLKELTNLVVNADVYYKSGDSWVKYTSDKAIMHPFLSNKEVGAISVDYKLERILVTLL